MHANDCTRARVPHAIIPLPQRVERRMAMACDYRVLITFGWMQCCDVIYSMYICVCCVGALELDL